MADPVSVKVEGLSELRQRLLDLPPKLARKGLRGANFDGAEVLVKAAKETSGFHDKTGELRAAIGAFRRGYKEMEATHAVGVRGVTRVYGDTALNRKLKRVGRKYRVAAGPALYGRFLEFGTSKMAPHPWLRPALFANVSRMVDAIRAGMVAAIDSYAKK